MPAFIAGLGTALPEGRVTIERSVEHAKQFSCRNPRQERVLEELYRRTTIATRASVVAGPEYGITAEHAFPSPSHDGDQGPGTGERLDIYRAEAAPLAMAASARAIAAAGIDKSDITHLVTVSCTGFYAPGCDIEVIQGLGLSPGVERTNVGFMGCHGAMNGLRVASALAALDAARSVLLCAVELCSIHFQYGWSTDKLVANSLFSDGAAALVVNRDGGTLPVRHVRSGSIIIPDSQDSMLWRIGNNGFHMHLSGRVPDLVQEHLPGWLALWLAEVDLSIRDISAWAVHPGGPRILEAVSDCLSLDKTALDHSSAVLSDCGNMSSPTVLFILERILREGIKGPCVILGFGPGLTVEAALLDL